MKISEVINRFLLADGGSAKVLYQLSKELAKRDHQITGYASDYKLGAEYISSIREIEVCSFKTWLGLAKFYMTPGIIRSTKEEIKHVDIIHMHN